MPIVTAAVVAVAAAIATTTVATVAAAAVAVSVVIGAAGLAVTAIGMATGNKDLMTAGKIMGFVALAGGAAGFAAGAMAGTTAAATTATTASTNASTTAAATAAESTASASALATPEIGQSVTAAIASAGQPAGIAGSGVLTQAPAAIGAGTVLAPGAATQAAASSVAAAAPSAISGASSAVQEAAPIVNQGDAGMLQAAAPSAPVPQGAHVVRPVATPAIQNVAPPAAPGAPTVTVGGNIPAADSWWSKLDPNAKAYIATGGVQTIAGAAGGLFQGQAAEAKMDLEKQALDQQQQQNQFVRANGSFAPRITFQKPTGLLGRA